MHAKNSGLGAVKKTYKKCLLYCAGEFIITHMSNFLTDLPGELGDDSPLCSSCCDTGTFFEDETFEVVCDCSIGDDIMESRREDDFEVDAQERLDNMDYQAGVAQGERYSSDRQIYGDALAEQFAMEDELASYNRGEF